MMTLTKSDHETDESIEMTKTESADSLINVLVT